MAEAGYVVLIIDPQGQGDSENCGHTPDGTADDVPGDQSAERHALGDRLHRCRRRRARTRGRWVPTPPARRPSTRSGRASTAEHARHRRPLARRDRGHADRAGRRARRRGRLLRQPRPGRSTAGVPRRTPTLFFGTDYAFPATGTPMLTPPDPTQHHRRLRPARAAGVDAMSITTRASDHYEFGYQPYPANFPSSRYGERGRVLLLAGVVRPVPQGRSRAPRPGSPRCVFDDSSDRHSIGAGTYDPARAAARPDGPVRGQRAVPDRRQVHRATCCRSTTRRRTPSRAARFDRATCGPGAAARRVTSLTPRGAS